MKCPYCAEDIKDEAVVCRHCSHDFSVVKPLLLRVISLEKSLESLSPASPAPLSETASLPFAALTSTLLGFTLTSGYLFLSVAPPLREAAIAKTMAVILPPVLLGLAAGATWWKRKWNGFLASGLTLGILNFLCTWFMMSRFEDLRFRWAWAFCVFVVGQTSTFVFAALVGKSLRNRWAHRHKPATGGPGPDNTIPKMTTILDLLLKVSLLVTAIFGNVTTANKYFGG